MRSLSCYVRIPRNIDADKKALEIRNIVRHRRVSESNVLPTQENRTRKNRRLSVDSALVRSRRSSIFNELQPVHIPDANAIIPNAPLVPFDDDFVQRLNRMANNGELSSFYFILYTGEIGEIAFHITSNII